MRRESLLERIRHVAVHSNVSLWTKEVPNGREKRGPPIDIRDVCRIRGEHASSISSHDSLEKIISPGKGIGLH